jgi:hypothetical protein
MDESLVGSPDFKSVREALTLSWVGSIPTHLRHPPGGGLRCNLRPTAFPENSRGHYVMGLVFKNNRASPLILWQAIA